MADHLLPPHFIKLMLCPREGGYRYVYSPDLPGFTYMLEPDEARSIETAIPAIHPVLLAYLRAKFSIEYDLAFPFADLRTGEIQACFH
jgi:hypothetical protein